MAAPPPVHVTYLALGGGGDGGAVFEAARSAFSLCRLSPKASVLLVTNTEALANAAAAKLRAVCRVECQRQRPQLQRSSGQLDGVPEDGARAAAVQRRELGAARGGGRLGLGFREAVGGRQEQGHRLG